MELVYRAIPNGVAGEKSHSAVARRVLGGAEVTSLIGCVWCGPSGIPAKAAKTNAVN